MIVIVLEFRISLTVSRFAIKFARMNLRLQQNAIYNTPTSHISQFVVGAQMVGNLKETCGIRPNRPASRMKITGGVETKPNSWPWVVSLFPWYCHCHHHVAPKKLINYETGKYVHIALFE